MGYYTSFEVSACGFDTDEHAEFFEFKFKKDTGLDGLIDNLVIGDNCIQFEIGETKWYDREKHLEALSKAFPNVTIEVYGDGEEQGDTWKMRVRNGDSEKVNGVVTFPEFKEILV